MGCDVHIFAEYRKRNPQNDWEARWHAVAYDQFWAPRDYLLFGHLAGVRYDPPEGPVAEPRGYPDLDYFGILDKVTLAVRKDEEKGGDYERSCTMAQAKSWGSEWVPGYGPDKDYPRVYDPDLHTPTWLSLAEYKDALRRADADPERYGQVDAMYHAVSALLCELEKRGHETRLVIAFDN